MPKRDNNDRKDDQLTVIRFAIREAAALHGGADSLARQF